MSGHRGGFLALIVALVLVGVWLPVGCAGEQHELVGVTEGVPKQTPAAEGPDEAPTVGVPKQTPAAEDPDETPTVGVPTQPPAVEGPEETPIVGVPTQPPAVEVVWIDDKPDDYGWSFQNCNRADYPWGPRHDYDVVAWSPDGSAVYFTDGGDVYGVTADGSRLWLIATATPPGTHAAGAVRRGWTWFAVAPDGMHLVYASCRYPPAVFTDPDGSEAVAVGWGFELVRIALDDGSVERLTANLDVEFYPAWSPDGRRIAYVSDAELADRRRDTGASWVNLYTMAADGTDIRPVLEEDFAVLHQPPAWSPDGRHLAVVRYGEEKSINGPMITDIGRQLYVVGTDGAEPRLLADNVVSGPSWSPDGQRLAIAQTEAGGVALYVIGIDGTGSRRVTGIEGWQGPRWQTKYRESPSRAWIDTVAWSPDGTQILVRSNVDQGAFAFNAETGQKTAIGVPLVYQPNISAQGVRAAAWSPDGSRIAMIAGGRISRGPDTVLTMAPDGTAIRVLATRGPGGRLQAQPVCRATYRVSAADCAALLDFKSSLAGSLALNWDSNRPVEQWTGVEVAGTPLRVVALNLSDYRLRGALPAVLGRLSQLHTLVLGDNSLDGPIPPELGQLSRLEVLDLSNNRLTGPIPAALGNLVNLRTLDLEANGLSGDIPPELGQLPDLEEVALGDNRFTGCVPPELPVDDLASLGLPDCEPA